MRPTTRRTLPSKNGTRHPRRRMRPGQTGDRAKGKSGEQGAHGHPGLGPAREEAAPRGCVLGCHLDRATPLAARAESLDEAQGHEQERGGPPIC
jgi:hypothetical protein